MPSLASIRAIATACALLGALGGLTAFGLRYRHLEGAAAGYAACKALDGGKPAAGAACDKAIAASLDTAARAHACDRDLASGPDRLFAASQSCSAAVAQLLAERAVRTSELADRDHTIDQLKADRSAAVARAEARAQSVERNRRNADAALAAAPRDPGGRILCNAECLRGLAGAPRP